MDKKEIASLKKIVKNGRDLTMIMSKYLDILEAAIASEIPAAPVKKQAAAKKIPAKIAAAKTSPVAKKTAQASKSKPIVKPAAKEAAKPVAKAAVKAAEKKPAQKTVAPAKKAPAKVEAPVAKVAQKVAKRGRPAKEKK